MDHNLNANPKTTKYLEENIEKNLCDPELGKDFLDMKKLRSILKRKKNQLDVPKLMSALQNTLIRKAIN